MISHAGLRSVRHDSGQFLFSQADPSTSAVSAGLTGLGCSEPQASELLDCDPSRAVTTHVITVGITTSTSKEMLNGTHQKRDSEKIKTQNDLEANTARTNSVFDLKTKPLSIDHSSEIHRKSLSLGDQSPDAALSLTGVTGKASEKALNFDLGEIQDEIAFVDSRSYDSGHMQSVPTAKGPTLSNCANSTGDPYLLVADAVTISTLPSASTTTCLQPAVVNPAQSSNITQTLNPLHYTNAKTVPRTAIKIYINAPILQEYQQRFRALVDFFKRAVDNDSFLKYRTKDVNYELRMCGKSPEDAHPTIVVFCTEDLFDKLSRLLESDTVKRQYRSRRKSILSPFRKKFSRELELPSPKLHFRMVFWRESSTPTKRKSADELIQAQLHSDMSTCGSLITFEGRTATLAMLVSVDSALYGLTVNHIRRPRTTEMDGVEYTKPPHDETPTLETLSNISKDVIMGDDAVVQEEPDEDSDSDASDVSWFHDVDYEDQNIEVCSSDGRATTVGDSSSSLGEAAFVGSKDFALCLTGHFVDVSPNSNPTRAYLDWALIRFEDASFERPNGFYPGGDPQEYVFLTKMAEEAPKEPTPVLMIGGGDGARAGFMLPGSAFIGGNPGQDLCEAWVVNLSCEVAAGDCGSLVVNALTWEVYGQVIASNPLGQAYIAPLKDTFEQITSDLGADLTSLPDPICGLIALSLHYQDSGEVQRAAETISHIPKILKQKQFPVPNADEKYLGNTTYKDLFYDIAEHVPDGVSGIDLLSYAIGGLDPHHLITFLIYAGDQATVQLATASGHVRFVRTLLDAMIEKEIAIDRKTLVRINKLATSLEFRGVYSKAEALYQRAYSIGLKTFGEYDIDTLTSGNGLGQVLEKGGSYKEAEALDLRISQARAKALGIEHPDTLTSISNYASALNCQGSYAKAEERNRFVLAARKRVLGDTHIDTMTSMSNLGDVLENSDKVLESEELHREVLALREKTLGLDHLDTITTVNNLAHVLLAKGDCDQAVPLARRASEGYEKVLGPSHPFTLASLGNLARALATQGAISEAEQLYKRVLAEKEDMLEPEHPSTLMTLTDLAQLYQGQNRRDEAKAMNLRALAAYKKTLGADHPCTLDCMYNQAFLLVVQKEYEEAAILYEQAWQGYKKLLGPDHPVTKACSANFQAMKRSRTYTSGDSSPIPSASVEKNVPAEIFTASIATALQLTGSKSQMENTESRVLWRGNNAGSSSVPQSS